MRTYAALQTSASLFDEFEEIKPTGLLRSPMNYIGGKFKLLPQILTHFPHKLNSFVDLFCGGCNVGMNVDANRIVFNDNLVYLIDLYRKLQTTCLSDILAHIHQRIEYFNLSLTNVDGYVALRSLYNSARNPLDLFVLVAYSFNHQIRFNSAHQFNNPFGKDRSSFNPAMQRNLIAFVERLHSIDCAFVSCNFDELDLTDLGENDFVYCDPPYLITTGTYNDGKRGFTGWNTDEEMKLLRLLDNLNSRGVKFALSNVLTHKGKENTLLIDWIVRNDYRVAHLAKNYANSSYHTSDRRLDASDEVLVLNYLSA